MTTKKKQVSKECSCSCPLDMQSFAFALAIVFAIGMFLFFIFAWRFGIGSSAVQMCAEIHKGVDATPKGAVLAAVWGFIDGLAGGAIFAYVYNRLIK